MNKIKRIAVIASADKKTDLIEWSYFNKNILGTHEIFAFGNTANVLEGTLNKQVNVSKSGNVSEYTQLCNLIENEKIDAVIIFTDAADILQHKLLSSTIETAIKYNILLATNRTTADFVINSSLIKEEYQVHKEEKKIADKISNAAATYTLAKAG